MRTYAKCAWYPKFAKPAWDELLKHMGSLDMSEAHVQLCLFPLIGSGRHQVSKGADGNLKWAIRFVLTATYV